MPGKSFSGLKSNGVPIPESEGMRLGKLVHTYLLKPKEYTWEQPEVVVPIARKMVSVIGTALIPVLEAECAITAKFVHEDITLDWKGMPDLHLKKVIVIDFKVIAGDLKSYIKTFGYDNQLIGYGAPIEAANRLIVAFNKKTQAVQTEFISYDPRWWQYQIKKYGYVEK